MKIRPWPLVIVALIQILTPLVSILMNALLYHIPLSVVLRAAATEGPWKTFLFFLVMPLGGLAIFMVKSWSYPVFITCLGITTVANLQSWRENSDQIPAWLLIAILTMDCVLVAYFLLPQVRSVYFNKRLRWWESRPRFSVNVDCGIEISGEKSRGKISNISTGGVFLQPPTDLPVGSEIVVSFSFFQMNFSIKGKVVHKGAQGYGIQWVSVPFNDRKRLMKIEQGMMALGIDSGRTEPKWDDFRKWLNTLVHERKGLVPNVPGRK